MSSQTLLNRVLGVFGLEKLEPPGQQAKPRTKTTATAAPKSAVEKKRTPSQPKQVAASPETGPPRPAARSRPIPTGNATTLPPRTAPVATSPAAATAPRQQMPAATPAPQASHDIMRTKRAAPTAAEAEELRNFTGQVLTAPEVENGLDLDEGTRKVCALLENGDFLRDNVEPFSTAILAAVMQIKKGGFPVRREFLVDRSFIRTFYDNAMKAKRDQSKSGATTRTDGGITTDISRQQQIWIDIVKQADELRASDIQIYIGTSEARVKMRVGGAYRKIKEYDAREMEAVFSAIYNLCETVKNTYDKRSIHQGVMPAAKLPFISDRFQGLRMQFNPARSSHAYLVARMITEEKNETLDISSLGYAPLHQAMFDRMRRMPYGLFYIVGPTGSGKSTTLKVSLEALAISTGGEASILTAEDPSEYTLDHEIVQMSMHGSGNSKERAEQYVACVASLLRADPDIVMIGEVREEESSSLAIKAATTGHSVWTTMHVNDAISSFARLKGMKAPDHDIYNHKLVASVVAQRLVRTVCPHCAMSFEDAKSQLSKEKAERYRRFFGQVPGLLERIRFRNHNGCPAHVRTTSAKTCKRGYTDRTTTAEILIPDAKFMELAAANRMLEAEQYWLDTLQGNTMTEHAFYKVVSGQCDPSDVETGVGDLDVIPPHRMEIAIERCGNPGESLLNFASGFPRGVSPDPSEAALQAAE
jgi:type II secretory ATPase GspE/PulE/Tfp pilus assembly ATPase PilB-like protein